VSIKPEHPCSCDRHPWQRYICTAQAVSREAVIYWFHVDSTSPCYEPLPKGVDRPAAFCQSTVVSTSTPDLGVMYLWLRGWPAQYQWAAGSASSRPLCDIFPPTESLLVSLVLKGDG
jgi:hypothetical protein